MVGAIRLGLMTSCRCGRMPSSCSARTAPAASSTAI